MCTLDLRNFHLGDYADKIGQLELQFASINICNAESATNVE